MIANFRIISDTGRYREFAGCRIVIKIFYKSVIDLFELSRMDDVLECLLCIIRYIKTFCQIIAGTCRNKTKHDLLII